jgi:hypothetical protein
MSWCLGKGTFAICWRITPLLHGVRTHLALDKDTPVHRPTQTVGRIASVSWLGGLHSQYVRMA